MKANQGMQRPSLGGIGSRFDVPLTRALCNHTPRWKLKAGGPLICLICHPPANGLDVEARSTL